MSPNSTLESSLLFSQRRLTLPGQVTFHSNEQLTERSEEIAKIFTSNIYDMLRQRKIVGQSWSWPTDVFSYCTPNVSEGSKKLPNIVARDKDYMLLQGQARGQLWGRLSNIFSYRSPKVSKGRKKQTDVIQDDLFYMSYQFLHLAFLPLHGCPPANDTNLSYVRAVHIFNQLHPRLSAWLVASQRRHLL